jgi:hypothetical protein
VAKIFISYRQQDTKFIVGRISDRLKESFGSDGVFMDINDIPFNVYFRQHLDSEVSQATAVLVLIGHGWVDARDEHGRRRLDNPNDYVRVEIETALRKNIPVGVVLIDGAPLPRSDQMPDSLRLLLTQYITQLDVARNFEAHMAQMISDLSKTKGNTVVAAPEPSSNNVGIVGRIGRFLLRILGALLIASTMLLLFWKLLITVTINSDPVPTEVYVIAIVLTALLVLAINLWPRSTT